MTRPAAVAIFWVALLTVSTLPTSSPAEPAAAAPPPSLAEFQCSGSDDIRALVRFLLAGACGPRSVGGEAVRVTRTDLLPDRMSTSAVWDPRARADCPRGCAYIFGGVDEAGRLLDDVLRYDPVGSSVEVVARLPTPRSGVAAVWDPIRHIAYVAGGMIGSYQFLNYFSMDMTNQTLEFDPATGRLRAVAPLPEAVCCMPGVWNGTAAYFFGGMRPTFTVIDVANRTEMTAAIQRYDPATNATTNLREGRQLAQVDRQCRDTLTATFECPAGVSAGGLPFPMCCMAAAVDPSRRPDVGCPFGCVYLFGSATMVHPNDDHAHSLDLMLAFDPASGTSATILAQCPETGGILSNPPEACRRPLLSGRTETCRRPSDDLDVLFGLASPGPAHVRACVEHRALPTLPTDRCCAAAVWDGRDLPRIGCPGGCVYLFGGGRLGGPDESPVPLVPTGEILRFNPRRSELVPVASPLPSPRSHASAVWTGERALLFGGFERRLYEEDAGLGPTPSMLIELLKSGRPVANVLGEIVRFDPLVDQSRVAHLERLASARTGASAVFDPAGPCGGGCAYLFGGWDEGYRRDVVRYSSAGGSVGSSPSALMPIGRVGASAAWDPAPNATRGCPTGCAYVFGGFKCDPATGCSFLNDVLRYDPSGDAFTRVASLPTGRWATAAAWDPEPGPGGACLTGCAYVFGGRSGLSTWLDEVVRWDPHRGTIERLSARLPSGREGATAVNVGKADGACAAVSCIYVLGGRGDGRYLDEIVRFVPETATLVSVTAASALSALPTPRAFASSVWDGTRIYLFGGETGVGAYTQEVGWYLPAVERTLVRRPALPSARCCTAAVWNGTAALVFAGWDRLSLNETVAYHPAEIGAVSGPARHELTLTWTPFVPGAASYRVHRGAGLGDVRRAMEEGGPPLVETTSLYFVDEGLADGETYCYNVTAVGPSGKILGHAVDGICGRAPSVPGPPGIPTLRGRPGQYDANRAEVGWSPAAENGGRPILGYRLVRTTNESVPAQGLVPLTTEGGSVRDEFAGLDLTTRFFLNRTVLLPAGPPVPVYEGPDIGATDPLLEAGLKQYRYCVTARNEIGEGPPACAEIGVLAPLLRPLVGQRAGRVVIFDDRDGDLSPDRGEELVVAPTAPVAKVANGTIRLLDDRDGDGVGDHEVASLKPPLFPGIAFDTARRVLTVWDDEDGDGLRDPGEFHASASGRVETHAADDGATTIYDDSDDDDEVDPGEPIARYWDYPLVPEPGADGSLALYQDANRSGARDPHEELVMAGPLPRLMHAFADGRFVVWDDRIRDGVAQDGEVLLRVRAPMHPAVAGPTPLVLYDDRDGDAFPDDGETLLDSSRPPAVKHTGVGVGTMVLYDDRNGNGFEPAEELLRVGAPLGTWTECTSFAVYLDADRDGSPDANELLVQQRRPFVGSQVGGDGRALIWDNRDCDGNPEAGEFLLELWTRR